MAKEHPRTIHAAPLSARRLLVGLRARLVAAMICGGALGLACGDDASGDDAGCGAGTLDCACFDDHSCFAGLICVSGTCTYPGNGQSGGSSSATAGGTEGTEGTDSATEGTGGAEGTEGTGGETDATTSAGETTSGTEDGGPVIVDFGSNVKAITEGESVVFTATIIDPDGPDDIQGGSLKSADESVTYGAFLDLGNGTYEISLAWAEIDQAIGVEFIDSQQVDVKAVFFDNGGKKGFASASVSLNCGADYAVIACDGHCVPADVDEDNCGTCGNACDDGVKCYGGSCAAEFSECLVTADVGVSTCAEYCATKGEVCANACYFGDSALYFWELSDACVDGDIFDQGSVEYGNACTNDLYLDPEVTMSVQCCCTIDAVWPDP
ncbi:MAG: hypothetical protein R3A79_16795 [Nannocystaceae bacterium]